MTTDSDKRFVREPEGWYYRDDDGAYAGPYASLLEAQTEYSKYRAQQGACPTCKGD